VALAAWERVAGCGLGFVLTAGGGFAVRPGVVLPRPWWARKGPGWWGLGRVGLDWLPWMATPLVAYGSRFCGGYEPTQLVAGLTIPWLFVVDKGGWEIKMRIKG
jgi:hypothetical protein